MALVVPHEGKLAIGDKVREYLGALGPSLGLYKNDVVPDSASTLADFEPATFPGYGGPQAITFNDPARLNDDGQAELDGSLVEFRCAGGGELQRIYGYYVVDASGTKLLWAERFSVRVTMFADTDRLAWVPTLTVDSAY